jgi:hypothetical protein
MPGVGHVQTPEGHGTHGRAASLSLSALTGFAAPALPFLRVRGNVGSSVKAEKACGWVGASC